MIFRNAYTAQQNNTVPHPIHPGSGLMPVALPGKPVMNGIKPIGVGAITGGNAGGINSIFRSFI